ncbi:PEPxxWA-CTERM sorting domain-containing protein [uncultured Sphingomonas sp.]|uniref:PEPxxWA-CTERM sorting domain-containing protein n=1 Tax=uncultured Sphingomonas sp. TaxID=158754 RepID=UPI0035CA56CF
MRAVACLTAGLAVLVAAPAAAQTQTYITNFAKTSNIYTALNQQYPNTGPGTPGDRTGTPNATNLFTPQATGQGNPDNLNYANNGISYLLASDAQGHDFAEVGTASFGLTSLIVPINVVDVTNFYLLAAAYNGTTFNITFNGTGGFAQTFSNIALPDFNGGAINTVGGGVSDQTVFRVYGVGGGGTGNSSNGAVNYYSLTQVGFDFGNTLAGRTLTSATITGNGYETLIFGATAVSPQAVTPGAVPEPATWAMMIAGFGLVGGAMRTRRREALAAA